MRVVVTEIGWEGRMRRRALDTSGLTDAGRWENLIEQVLASPPAYKAAPGRPVYVIHAGDRAVLVGEQDLAGPLADLADQLVPSPGAKAFAAATQLRGGLIAENDRFPRSGRASPLRLFRRARPWP